MKSKILVGMLETGARFTTGLTGRSGEVVGRKTEDGVSAVEVVLRGAGAKRKALHPDVVVTVGA